MASMLRSLRFVRRLNAGGRRLGPSALHRAPSAALLASSNVTRTSLERSVVCLQHQDTRNYVTKAAVASKRDFEPPVNVDDMLRDIDRKTKSYGYIFEQDVENVMQSIAVRGTITSTQALLLIRCCGYFMLRETPQKRQGYVNKIWDMAQTLNVPMDVSHYNALLLVYLDNDTDFSPVEILIQMNEKNIAPNRVTFQRLIEQYCKKGDIPGATKILEHMSEHDIPLNESIFNSLIMGHSNANDVPSALKILDIMKQANVEPTSRTYAAILCVHAKRGDQESMKAVLQDCKTNDIIFQDKDLLEVVYTLAVNNHQDLVDEVISNIEKSVVYNRNALPYICKLLDKGEPGVAYKLQKSLVKLPNDSFDTPKNSDGILFLRKLLLSNCDADTAVKYCSLMVTEKINTSAFETALYIAYKNKMQHLAIPLLKAMKDFGLEIREHYFYPILVYYSKASNLQGILQTMKTMMFDFSMPPMILTTKDYVVPYMVDDPLTNVKTLLNNSLPFGIATNAILMHLLEENKTRQAMKFLMNTQMNCRMSLLEKQLVNSYFNTKDANTLASILHYNVCTRNNKNEDEDNENSQDIKELNNPVKFVNTVIDQVVARLPTYDVENVTNILKSLVEKGLHLNSSTITRIKNHLGENITTEINDALTKLSSGSLQLAPLEREPGLQQPVRLKYKNLSILEEKAETSVEHKMFLTQEQAKMMNSDAVEKLVTELESQNPTYTVGYCATLLDYYCKMENIDQADKWFNRLHEVDANCKLDKNKILRYAQTLVINNRWADALKVLEHPSSDGEFERTRLCERLMHAVSDHCPEQTEEFFDKLNKFNFISKVTNGMLGPVIKYYVESDDMVKALEKFKWACENYKITPHKGRLMAKLIEREDAKTLQDFTGLCTKVYGESNALFDLAMAFIECNRPRQARKILETPGLQVRQERIVYTAKMLAMKNEVQGLEQFIQLVTGLRYDLNPLYDMLLQLYERENDWQKSLALWTQMQDDNVQPTVKFMDKLETILKMNNQEVPFAPSAKMTSFDESIANFSKALKSGNASEAKQHLKNIPEKVRSNHLLQLIDHYLDVEDVDAALANLKEFWEMKHASVPPFRDTLTTLFEKLKDTNDFSKIVQTLTDAKEFCDKHNQNFAYTYIVNNAFYKSDKYEDLFNYMESSLQDKTQAEKILPLLYHSIVPVQYLFDRPQFEIKFNDFAFKAADCNFWAPINSLWVYKFLSNSPDAESFFKEHVKKFMSINVIYACKEIGAWNKLPQVSSMIMESSDLKFADKRRNASILLRIILNSEAPNKYDLALECLRSIVKVVPFNTINASLISQIEENCQDKDALQSLRTNGENKSTNQEAAATG